MRYEICGDHVIDLSQTLESGIPAPVGFPDPSIEFFKQMDKGDVINVEKIVFCPLSASHVDAPYHFIKNGITVDQVDPGVIAGSAVVVDLRYKEDGTPIEKKDITDWEQKTGEKIQEGDAVLLMTGFSKYWELNDKEEKFLLKKWPYVTKSVAEYFVKKKIRLVGVESMDLDLIDPFDLSSSEFIGHRTFLPNGIYIIENLTNLDKIGRTRCSIIATPLKIKGATGSPVRVIAIV